MTIETPTESLTQRAARLSETPAATAPPRCLGGMPCQTPPSGGACAQCGYPRAYAHPSCCLNAFRVEAVWIAGTAIHVEARNSIPQGVVHIVQRDGSLVTHLIPGEALEDWEAMEGKTVEPPAPVNQTLIPGEALEVWEAMEGKTVEPPAPVDQTHNPYVTVQMFSARLSVAQPRETANEVPTGEGASEALSIAEKRDLLLYAAKGATLAHHPLSGAILAGLAALSGGWLSPTDRDILEHYRGPALAVSTIQKLLRLVNRRLSVGPQLALDDNRPNRDVLRFHLGPFAIPLSRLRLALLPGEADHVEIYDIRVGELEDYPIGLSVISRVPGYEPGTVREVPDRVDIGGTLVGRYLPGTVLAGQLRDGADPVQLSSLSPHDLRGGVEIDLGCTFPTMSYVYLFYRVAPGHVFCAAVEPIETV